MDKIYISKCYMFIDDYIVENGSKVSLKWTDDHEPSNDHRYGIQVTFKELHNDELDVISFDTLYGIFKSYLIIHDIKEKVLELDKESIVDIIGFHIDVDNKSITFDINVDYDSYAHHEYIYEFEKLKSKLVSILD